MTEKCLYTMRDYMEKPKHVQIDNNGIIHTVNGNRVETPIEDYGDYLLVEKPIKNAFDVWIELVERGES